MTGGLGRLALGTVQFGLDYGIANTRGRVDEDEASAILRDAVDRGVDLIDTGAAYGEVEVVLGRLIEHRPLRVVTKTARIGPGGVAAVLARARGSLRKLGRPKLHAILVHAAQDLAGRDGDALWRGLRDLQAEGLFDRVGISAYHRDDPAALAARFAPDLMQVPASLLDQRLVRDGTLRRLAAAGIEVHLRSIFLQGLLFLPPDRLPAKLAHAAAALQSRQTILSEAGVSPLRAALHYALGLPQAGRIVVGVTSLAEWREIAAAAEAPGPRLDWDLFALEDPVLLDPSAWAEDCPR